MSAAATVRLHQLEDAIAAAEVEGRDANVRRWLRFAHVRPGDVVELQALAVPFGNSERTYVAHGSTTTEVLRLLDEAKQYKCPGLYVIANRVDAAVATRLGIDKWNPAAKGSSTTDRDIVCRTVLFIDIDSKRPRGTSATDDELHAAIEIATRVHDWIAGMLAGLHAVGYGASGNGRGVYVALDDIAEADAGARVKAILVGLDALFSTETAKVDTAVSDAKRLVPAHGTMKRKGVAGNADRPHRMTTFTCADRVRRIGVAQLDHLIGALREALDAAGNAAIDKALGIKSAKVASPAVSHDETSSPFARANATPAADVLSWLGLLDGDRPRCPGCGESDSGVAIIGTGLKCSHARCAAKGYREGYRTPVDLVAEVRDVTPKEAVVMMAERFGFDGFRSPEGAAKQAAAAVCPALAEPIRPGDRVRALGQLGPVIRFETGIPTLDRGCRGGLPTRRLVVVGGAPSAGKTSLVTHWAWRWAKAGIVVGILAVDEGPEGTIARIAQLEGMSPEKLEERDPATLERLAGMLDASALILVDGEDAAGTVEGVAELVARAAAGKPAALVIDSLQTVVASGTETAGSPRERVDAVVRAMKSARDQHALLVIGTCELARGAYRSRSLAETINDLAAFKESGSVEYAAQTALVLRSVPEESALVDVTVPKNRAYRRDPFRLRMDLTTTAYVEVDLPDAPSRDLGSDRFDAVRRGVVHAVATDDLRSARSIVRAVRAAGHHFRDADIFDAVKVMQDEGALTKEGGEPFRITVPAEAEEDTNDGR